MTDDFEIHASSGNIFDDMGMRDAEERLAKAELARVVRGLIRDRNITQQDAADLLGVKQPDVSDLMRGQLARFSLSRLERFLNALGMDIRIQIAPCQSPTHRPGIVVELVDSF